MISSSLHLLAEKYDALVVANGNPPRRTFLASLRARCSQVVALDGGLNTLYRYRMLPDFVVGDLDSARPESLAWAKAGGCRVVPRPSVDEPDFVKGLKLCRAQGLKRLLVTGVVGERLDHVLGAIYLSFQVRGVQVEFVTSEVVAYPLSGRVARSFYVPPGHTLSWFAIGEAGPCSLSGVRWPFRRRLLKADGFHSLSNLPAGDRVMLTQQAGRSVLLVSLFPQATV